MKAFVMIYNNSLSRKAPPVIGVAVAGIITWLNDIKREKIELAIDDWISSFLNDEQLPNISFYIKDKQLLKKSFQIHCIQLIHR